MRGVAVQLRVSEKRASVVTRNGYPVIRAESPLAIDVVGAFELLEVGMKLVHQLVCVAP